jgi:F-type H+-transporting ATPase subunit b
MVSPFDFAVLAASLIEVNPGLTFWTIITFIVVFVVLRMKAWGPILQMVQDREKAILEAIEAAKRERQEAEKMLAEQKQAIAEARREAAELVKKNQAEVERAREELIAKSRKEAEQLVASATRQIEDAKLKAMAEVRGYAVDLALQAANKLVESSLDEKRQRELVTDFIKKIESEKAPQA